MGCRESSRVKAGPAHDWPGSGSISSTTKGLSSSVRNNQSLNTELVVRLELYQAWLKRKRKKREEDGRGGEVRERMKGR